MTHGIFLKTGLSASCRVRGDQGAEHAHCMFTVHGCGRANRNKCSQSKVGDKLCRALHMYISSTPSLTITFTSLLFNVYNFRRHTCFIISNKCHLKQKRVLDLETNAFFSLFGCNQCLLWAALLDPSNSLHLFCAHYTFVKRLQKDLYTFKNGWHNHALRTEENLTPNQLWTKGLLQNPVAAPAMLRYNSTCAITDVL